MQASFCLSSLLLNSIEPGKTFEKYLGGFLSSKWSPPLELGAVTGVREAMQTQTMEIY